MDVAIAAAAPSREPLGMLANGLLSDDPQGRKLAAPEPATRQK
jgi:hypothetical protein